MTIIISYVIINLAGFVTFITIWQQNYFNQDFPPQFFLGGFLIIAAAIFSIALKKNFSPEEISLDSQAINTGRFGAIYLNDITGHKFHRRKRSEDIVLMLSDGKKISFGPTNPKRGGDRTVYKAFKEIMLSRISKT